MAPFESLKSMLIYVIESIKAVGEPQRVKSLVQLVEIGEWRRQSQADLVPLIEEELASLSVQMQ